jgi:hypothetical protein
VKGLCRTARSRFSFFLIKFFFFFIEKKKKKKTNKKKMVNAETTAAAAAERRAMLKQKLRAKRNEAQKSRSRGVSQTPQQNAQATAEKLAIDSGDSMVFEFLKQALNNPKTAAALAGKTTTKEPMLDASDEEDVPP